MSEFDENVRAYRRKKQDIIETGKTVETGKVSTGALSNAPVEKEKNKAQYSFNTFVVAMLVQSTFVAGHRLGIKPEDNIDTNDPKVREEIRKVFRELCFLNGINPENMADIDNKSALG
ncbi:MAG: hypothetical protein K5770_11465 [Lachnospiraceae bacterium]|nr:hypothetical protein [Lachnospiraceae bacterium]